MPRDSSFLDELDVPAEKQVDEDVVNIVLGDGVPTETDDLEISLKCRKCLQDCEVADRDLDHCVAGVKVMSDKAMAIKHDLENLNDERN